MPRRCLRRGVGRGGPSICGSSRNGPVACNGDDSGGRFGAEPAHLMRQVSRKIGAIAFFQDVGSIRCPHLHRTTEDEEHFLPVMPLPVTGGIGANMEKEGLHQAAFWREQLETIGAIRVLHGASSVDGTTYPHGIVGGLLAEQLADGYAERGGQAQDGFDGRTFGSPLEARNKTLVQTCGGGKGLDGKAFLQTDVPQTRPDRWIDLLLQRQRLSSPRTTNRSQTYP